MGSTAPRAVRVSRAGATTTTATSTFVFCLGTFVLALSLGARPTAAARALAAAVPPLPVPSAALACGPFCITIDCRCPTNGDALTVCQRQAASEPGGAAAGVCLPFASIAPPATQLPRARQALAAAVPLEGVGWAFAPAGRGSGVAVLFYPGGLVTPESYAVLATNLADLGHAVVLIAAATEAGAYIRPLKAQLQRFVWDMGCVYGLFSPCSGGARVCLGCVGCFLVSDTAKVELKSGRV
jgi:hypothetical protein